MSDVTNFQLPDEQPDDSEAIRNMRAHIKALETDNASKTADLAQGATLAKENAFLKAGVDLKDPVAAMLLNAYDGELDETAIQAAAVAVRLTPGEPAASSTPTEPAVVHDPAQTAERNALANEGGGAAQLPAEDPVQAGYADFYQDLAAGKSREDAAPAVLGRIIAAANAGDPRFAFDAQAWTNQAEAKSR